MKKIIKKNQIIITALAIMIIIAGYLTFTKDVAKDKKGLQEVDNVNNDNGLFEIANNLNQNNNNDINNINNDDRNDNNLNHEGTDRDNDLNNDINDDNTIIDDKNNTRGNELGSNEDDLHTSIDVSDTGELKFSEEDKDIPGEAILVNNSINSEYFFSAKLSREQTRSQLKADYMEIINNTNISEKEKEAASNNMMRMINNAEKENAAEILLEAKGFDGVVVSITEEMVDVIVNTSSEVTEQQKAIIEDVIKRKTEVTAENIIITPVVVHE